MAPRPTRSSRGQRTICLPITEADYARITENSPVGLARTRLASSLVVFYAGPSRSSILRQRFRAPSIGSRGCYAGVFGKLFGWLRGLASSRCTLFFFLLRVRLNQSANAALFPASTVVAAHCQSERRRIGKLARRARSGRCM